MGRRWMTPIVGAGILVGVLAAVLQKLGNPPNMGLCVACMVRDIAGAIGLHRAAAVQYLRPEIIGITLGSMAAAVAFREFRPRGGSAALARFVLGMLAMMGALVFLGCPWRAYLRLAGGDLTAVGGILGLIAGCYAGTLFLRSGYSLGRARPGRAVEGWILPALMVVFLVLAIAVPQFGRAADGARIGPIFVSESGPGSMSAPLLVSLLAGLLIGWLLQRTRLCTVGAIRDVLLIRDGHLLRGIAAMIAAAFIANLALGQFSPGVVGQPIAHPVHLWNFLGMTLAGLAFVLAGGCPGRQLVLAGEGDADAGTFAIGMLVGAGVAHNFGMASSPAGPGPYGPAIVVIGLVICIIIGLSYRKR